MLERLSIRQKFRLLLALCLLTFGGCAVVVLTTLSEVRVNGPLYQQVTLGNALVADVLPPPGLLLEPYLVAVELGQETDGERQAQLVAQLRQLKAQYDGHVLRWKRNENAALLTMQKQLADRLGAKFFDLALGPYLLAIEGADRQGAREHLQTLRKQFQEQRVLIDAVVAQADASSRKMELRAEEKMRFMVGMLGLMGAIVVITYLLVLKRVEHSIANPIEDVLRLTHSILSGDWRIRTAVQGTDEASQVLRAVSRIVETTQKELVKAEKMAALGSLVAGISHELNTPVGNSLLAVTTVDGEVKSFKEKSQAGMTRTRLDQFVGSVEGGVTIAIRNLERTVELVQSFKQVAIDRSSSNQRKFDLAGVVADTLLMLHPRIKQSNTKVVANIPKDIALDSYPGPLGQVLSNLVENALIHGAPESGEGLVTITATEKKFTGTIVITVRDNGKGIPPNDLPKIFDPFFTTRMGSGGTGLGLHISHNIVYQLLGGSITVKNSDQGGTEFELVVPAVAT